jgi:hypothetical protein
MLNRARAGGYASRRPIADVEILKPGVFATTLGDAGFIEWQIEPRWYDQLVWSIYVIGEAKHETHPSDHTR